MGRFVDIDLAGLGPLPIVAGDADVIYAERIAELTARLAKKGIAFDLGKVDSNPFSAIEQAGAFRELVTLARRDDAIRAVMLASSWGRFLDHLGATQTPPVARLALVAEPRSFDLYPEDWERDDDLRDRIRLAPESLSAAGPEGAYLSIARGVPGVKSAAVYGPESFGGTYDAPFTPLGVVHVVVVSTAGDGAASPELVEAVQKACRAYDRRPIADFVVAKAATIVPYTVDAVLYVGPGADRGLIEDAGRKRLERQTTAKHRPGAAVVLRQLYGALFVPSEAGVSLVEDVSLSLSADVNGAAISPASPGPAYCAPYCEGLTVTAEAAEDD
mgnify:CR=1 FL=1|jgi:phage-related baseplate assembly protein